MNITYTTKRFGPISTAKRDWREDSKMSWTHGYGRICEITFAANDTDENGWILSDFEVREIDRCIRREWECKILLDHDDPLLEAFESLERLGGCALNVLPSLYGTSVEKGSHHIFDVVRSAVHLMTDYRVTVQHVRVWEHENNSATYGSFPNQ